MIKTSYNVLIGLLAELHMALNSLRNGKEKWKG